MWINVFLQQAASNKVPYDTIYNCCYETSCWCRHNTFLKLGHFYYWSQLTNFNLISYYPYHYVVWITLLCISWNFPPWCCSLVNRICLENPKNVFEKWKPRFASFWKYLKQPHCGKPWAHNVFKGNIMVLYALCFRIIFHFHSAIGGGTFQKSNLLT